jgi:hypothetical protein
MLVLRLRSEPPSDRAPRRRQTNDWVDWYQRNIALADDLYDEDLRQEGLS